MTKMQLKEKNMVKMQLKELLLLMVVVKTKVIMMRYHTFLLLPLCFW